MRLAFLVAHFGIRGTERAIYDYACAFEDELGGESWVVYPDGIQHRLDHRGERIHFEPVFAMFQQRFGGRMVQWGSFSALARWLADQQFRGLYVLKSGEQDGLVTDALPTLVHCVFQANQPHGSRYCAISPCLSGSAPVVPHIVRPLRVPAGLAVPGRAEVRARFGISEGALVVGRYGGRETFDIPFVRDLVRRLSHEQGADRLRFVFMNTEPIEGSACAYLEATHDETAKAVYIDLCDVMLHARRDGESFGLAVCEFALRGKPVMAYSGPDLSAVVHRHHEQVLGAEGLFYQDEASLHSLFTELLAGRVSLEPRVYPRLASFTPRAVMAEFKKHFLD